MPTIVKADGSTEVFKPERLEWSLRRSGAGPHTAARIAETIAKSVVASATSKEIYAKAFALLRKEARPVAARYALRRALFEFGPSGHPFEDFISHLFQKEGWAVETRKMIPGKCVMHEVDFLGTRGNERLAAELKYHNDPGYKTDLKVALYVKSRFDDIWQCDPKLQTCPIDRGMLVTNTKFTTEAIRYAECSGVELLGWSYPDNDNLFTRMSKAKVYPITTLTTLSHAEKRLLVDRNISAVDMLFDHRDIFAELHLSPEQVGDILAEADGLLSLPHMAVDMPESSYV